VAHLVELAADSSQIDMQEHALLAISNLADNGVLLLLLLLGHVWIGSLPSCRTMPSDYR